MIALCLIFSILEKEYLLWSSYAYILLELSFLPMICLFISQVYGLRVNLSKGRRPKTEIFLELDMI